VSHGICSSRDGCIDSTGGAIKPASWLDASGAMTAAGRSQFRHPGVTEGGRVRQAERHCRPYLLHHDHVDLRGSGFTAKSNAYSHLRRPDGSEFPVLPIVTNERGEFEHDIDTLLLGPGTFEVSVKDSKSKATSNVARFEVTTDPARRTQ
jgi:hypothetical protein